MPDKHRDSASNQDAFLDKLIHLVGKRREAKLVRPDEEAITSYLMGTATAEQEKRVKEALLRSARFRREILQMAEDMDAFSGPPGIKRQREGVRASAPDRREFLGRYEQRTAVDRGYESLWTKLMRWRIPQVYAPVAVAAVVVFLVIVRTGIFGPGTREVPVITQWSLISRNVEPGLLISNITREAVGQAEKVYATTEEAALAEFRFLLEYDQGQFHLRPLPERPETTMPFRTVSLILLDAGGERDRQFHADVPLDDLGDQASIEAWLLTIPSRNLYTIPVATDTTLLKWLDHIEPKGCLTFTYTAKKGYRAAPGFTFELE